jgi:hypothetical protein
VHLHRNPFSLTHSLARSLSLAHSHNGIIRPSNFYPTKHCILHFLCRRRRRKKVLSRRQCHLIWCAPKRVPLFLFSTCARKTIQSLLIIFGRLSRVRLWCLEWLILDHFPAQLHFVGDFVCAFEWTYPLYHRVSQVWFSLCMHVKLMRAILK